MDSATDYDPAAFDRPSVTVDIVAFTARAGVLHLLLVRRGVWPFEGAWALPGGFVRLDESLDAAAQRELVEETGIGAGPQYLEQLYTFGDPGRDPRTRVISVAYVALLPPPKIEPRGGTDSADAHWFPAEPLPLLAFDHAEIVARALERLRSKLGYTSVAYGLLPDEFTLTELQDTYSLILGKPLDKRNFRKWIQATGLLEDLGRQRRGGAHRPAALFRFARKELIIFG